MTKLATILGLVVGLAALAIVSVAGLPSSGVQAREDGVCRSVPVAVDEGYGVTRTTVMSRCGD